MNQGNFQGSGRVNFNPHEGESWICADCGKEINELPFDPRRDENGVVIGKLYCRECHRKRRGSFRKSRRRF